MPEGGDNKEMAAKWRGLWIERDYGLRYEVLWTLQEYFDLPVNGKKTGGGEEIIIPS